MSAKLPSRWNPTIAPPSQADPRQHQAYFVKNAEAPPSAVLVFHGIGEEVRFETLSRAASLLLTEAESRKATNIGVVIRSVPKDATATALEVRAELSWIEADGTKRQVHVYETYWAPLTTGKVNYAETVSFLASAGWNGLRETVFSGRPRTFQRWLFGEFKPLKIRAGTAPLLVVLMVMIGFVAAIIAMAASAVAGVGKQIGSGSPQAEFVQALTFIYGQIVNPWNAGINMVGWIGAHMFGRAAATGFVQHIIFAQRLSWDHWVQALVAFLAWAGLIRGAFWVRSVLTQYAGSLVAYLSPYKDSKWEDLRHEIQQRGLDVASIVYEGYRLPSGWIPEYQKIIILGHSLGSVIAYDTLNAMINLQAARLHAGAPNPVIERTPALITFGSPLDKTAFLFRVQLKLGSSRLDEQGVLRETMVSAVQPLIADYDQYRFNKSAPPNRPKWINIWSRRDVVSGRLEYYDDPALAADDPRRVQNIIDPEARIPIAAHNQYWTKKLLRKTLYDQL